MQNSHKWHFYLVMSKKCCIFAVILTQSSTTMTFIKELSKRRSNYAHPDQATTQAKSLDQLSSGVYTEDERFIYELLQNAVDSFSPANGSLDINIVAQEGYLVFMHNGEAFSKRDVEGLCDVGNGNKMKDIQKIGYKGIGFKSVFRASNCVHIQSGDFCFKFDKAVWNNYWDSNWKDEYGEKDLDKNYLMPWQIIPIETTAPIQIDTIGYNVVTYIQTKNLAELSESVKTLLKTSQFLLFLTAKNVRMTYVESGVPQQIIEKHTFDNEISLLVNGKEESRWLYHMIPNVPINDEELRLRIAEDQKTPDKLKIDEHGKTLSVNTFDIAFAVQIENKDGERIVKTADNPVMYTYLPTSFKFGDEGFPFLVNANFITDAGREQLIKDSEWNKLLISKIPELYLKWVATFSREIKNYYDVLPKKSYGVSDKLRLVYDTAAKSAIETIPFIPSLKTNQLLKGSDAFIDRIGLAEVTTHQLLFAHIDRIYSRTFEQESNIVANKGVTILKQYGVFVFDQSKFKAFFDDQEAIIGISSDEDVKLIRLLHEYCLQNEDSNFERQLHEIPFLLNNHDQLALPCQLCTHVLEDADEINADVQTINGSVYEQLSQTNIDWLKKMGLSEPSDTSIIDTGRLFEENYMTTNNAIEICRYLFKLHINGVLEESHYNRLKGMKILTKNENLLSVTDSYLANIYKPNFAMESHIDIDFFISENYIDTNDSPSEWGVFFEKIGAGSDLSKTTFSIPASEVENTKVVFSDYAKKAKKLANQYSWISYEGWDFGSRGFGFWASWICFSGIPYLPYAKSYDFSHLLWNKICSEKEFHELTNINDCFYASGTTGMIHRVLGKSEFKQQNFETSYLKWVIENAPIFPAIDKKCYFAKDLYANTIPNIKLLADTYLPIIDIDEPLKNSWVINLGLKTNITIDDYLTILTKITDKEQITIEDKDRINKIYNLLAEQLPHLYSIEKNKFVDWGKSNKVLATDDEFYSPSELNYTTLDGFTSNHQVYIGKIEEKQKFIELLKLFGVKIYTEENIEEQIVGAKIDTQIQSRLLSALPILALIASDGKDHAYFTTKCNDLKELIENNTFYSCDSIRLVFRDATGEAERQTYATKGHFYYTGKLTASKIEPLLYPLCSLLGIKRKERELFVIMVENDYDAILDFFREKGYPVQWITDINDAPKFQTIASAQIGGAIINAPLSEQQIAENCEAKTLVLDHLSCMGFDVDNVEENCSLINGVTLAGADYPIVVKSCKNYHHSMHLNPSEWQQLFRPNSMLWVHLGNRVVVPIKAFDLLTYQDRVTLSFGSVNLLEDDRVHKIMHVMKYFNDVHLDIASMDPNTNRGETLDDILFNNNNLANSDLGEDTGIEF